MSKQNRIQLRPYQQQALEQTLQAVDDYESDLAFGSVDSDTICVAAPTSWGKTYWFLSTAQALADRGERVLIVMPIKALVKQFIESATSIKLDIGVIAAGFDDPFPDAKIKLCMLQTLKNRVEKGEHSEFADCILMQDEIHKFAKTGTIVSIKNKLQYKLRIGATGTPYNAFGYELDNIYRFIETATHKQLHDGDIWFQNISTYTAKFAEKIDFDKVKITSSGDFDQSELSELIETDSYINGVISAMNELNLSNKKTLIFTSSIDTAERLNQALQQANYSSATIHSKQKKKLSDAILDSFNHKKPFVDPNNSQMQLPEFNSSEDTIINCLINVNVLSTGYDDTSIEALILATSISSRPKVTQILGRLVRQNRSVDHKLYLDCGSNFARFGFHLDHFTPVPRTNDKQKDKLNIATENAKHSLPLLSELLDDSDNLTQLINRKWYVDKVNELNQIEQDLFDKARRTEEQSQLAEQAKREQISLDQARINHEQQTLRDMAKVLRTTNNLDHLAKAYIFMYIYIHGRPISKAGNPYTPPHHWFTDKWSEQFINYPDMQPRWTKALRTRARNIIKDGKNINGLSHFVNFLAEKHQEELEQQVIYHQASNQTDNSSKSTIDIEDDFECPF